MTGFGERLQVAFRSRGHLCVGIDPHPYLLDVWGLADTAEGLREFGLRTVEAAADRVGIVKPQVAFFERHGSAGYGALESTLEAARDAGLLVIADVKRGDVGTSVEAYGQAWLSPGSPLEVDAMTIAAYQGVGSIDDPIRLALSSGKGLLVLAATSNPEALPVQSATVTRGEFAGRSVAASIVDEVNRSNRGPLGSVGVVIGATVDLADYGLVAADLDRTPVLAPGFGFQGASFAKISGQFGTSSRNVIVSSSRDILAAGPRGIATAVRTRADELAGALDA